MKKIEKKIKQIKPIGPEGGFVTPGKLEKPENTLSWDLGAGLSYNIDTPLTEKGSGKNVGGNLYTCPNTKDCYGLGFELQFDTLEGGDFYNDSSHSRYMLSETKLTQTSKIVSEGREVLTVSKANSVYAGFGNAGSATTLELGKESAANILMKPFGRFPAFSLRPHFGIFSSIPTDSNQNENISTLAARAGIDFRLAYADAVIVPAPAGLTDYDPWQFALHQVFGVLTGYQTAKTASANREVSDYTDQLFGGGPSSPSARLEGIPALMAFNGFLGGYTDSEMNLMLKATQEEKTVVLGAKVAATLVEGGLSTVDKSSTMLTMGFTDGLKLINYAIGSGMDLDLAGRRSKKSPEKLKLAENFLLYRSLVNSAAFFIGIAAQGNRAGDAILQSGQQAMLFTSLSPDDADTGLIQTTSFHLAYEIDFDANNFVGVALNYNLTPYLYTGASLLLQSSPFSYDTAQQFSDSTTGRDATRDQAKAKTIASLGLQTETGVARWSIGARTLIEAGGSKPLPGVGLEGGLMLATDEKKGLEVGLKLALDRMDGNFQPTLTPSVGGRF